MKFLSSCVGTDLVRLGIYLSVTVIPIMAFNPLWANQWQQPIIVGGGPGGGDIWGLQSNPFPGFLPYAGSPPYSLPGTYSLPGPYSSPVSYPGPVSYLVPAPIAGPAPIPSLGPYPLAAPYPGVASFPGLQPPYNPSWPYSGYNAPIFNPAAPYSSYAAGFPYLPPPPSQFDHRWVHCEAFCVARKRHGGKCVPYLPLRGTTGDVKPAQEKLTPCPPNLMCTCDDRWNNTSD